MRFLFKPETFVPFVGICWGFGQFTVSLWPFVVTIGRSQYGKQLADIEARLRKAS